jgi:hypothetical protein
VRLRLRASPERGLDGARQYVGKTTTATVTGWTLDAA